MPEQNLLLYTTLGCHLCELAEQVALSVINPGRYKLVKIEISESDELMARYGLRIPVMAVQGQSAEIGWPFDARQFAEFLLKGETDFFTNAHD